MSFKFPLVSTGYYSPISYMRRTDGNTKSTQGVNYATANESAGTDISYVPDAGFGDSFLINTNGIYAVCLNGNTTLGGAGLEIHIAPAPVGVDGSLSANSRGRQNNANNITTTQSFTGFISAGSVVWGFQPGPINAGTNINQISVTRVR